MQAPQQANFRGAPFLFQLFRERNQGAYICGMPSSKDGQQISLGPKVCLRGDAHTGPFFRTPSALPFGGEITTCATSSTL